MSKLFEYISETKEEMKHVTWPTRKQTFVYTALVIVISIIVSIFLGAFDALFTKIISSFI